MIYSKQYLSDIRRTVVEMELSRLAGKTLCLTGATGLIGSYLIDCLMAADIDLRIICLVRDEARARSQFSLWREDRRLVFGTADLRQKTELEGRVDYLIHAASPTGPYQYSVNPVATMDTNYIGTKQLLDLASEKGAKFMFVSSSEVYGKNDTPSLKETNYGYIDILDTRACYNESKRAAETLCVCYAKEKEIKVVIPRLSRVYGPTMKLTDSKAMSQFLVNAASGRNIVLKSEGTQQFNYTYVGDVARALVILLTHDNAEVAYNIANPELVPLRQIAEKLAALSNARVVFDLPAETEARGYSKCLISSLDSSRFAEEYHFSFETPLDLGLKNTLPVLKERMEAEKER